MTDVVVTAREVVDELVADDGAVVLVEIPGGHRVVRLSPLGQLIRELSVHGVALGVLVRQLEDRLGALDDDGQALRLTTEAVEALEGDDLVTVERGTAPDTEPPTGD